MAKNMKKTLTYKNFVANLKSQPVYKKEAALLKALAGGTQWRIDAVLDAIDTDLTTFNEMDTVRIFDQAAMFGRVAAIQRLANNDFFEFGHETPARYRDNSDPRPDALLAAFDTAVIHGQWKVADYCLSVGATAGQDMPRRHQRAIYFAVDDGDIKKIDYLIAAKARAETAFYYAISQAYNAQLHNNATDAYFDVVRHLLTRGIDFKETPNYASRALSHAASCNQADIVEALLKQGVVPHSEERRIAQEKNLQKIVSLLDKYAPAKTHNPPPAP